MAKPVHTFGCDELFILDPIMYFHLGKGIHTTSQSYQAVMNESGVEYMYLIGSPNSHESLQEDEVIKLCTAEVIKRCSKEAVVHVFSKPISYIFFCESKP